jgi:hypothetical protein
MLEKALVFISNLLNKELKMAFGLTDDPVVVGSLINLDGSITKNIENKVVLSIINLEHEKVVKHNKTYVSSPTGAYHKVNPPVHLNLYVLASANYNSGNYMEALKMLSSVIGVFQASKVFTANTYPELAPYIERLTLEIYNVPVQELSHVWSGIGAKYVPSILYKVRMISIEKDRVQEEISGITDVTIETNNRNANN